MLEVATRLFSTTRGHKRGALICICSIYFLICGSCENIFNLNEDSLAVTYCSYHQSVFRIIVLLVFVALSCNFLPPQLRDMSHCRISLKMMFTALYFACGHSGGLVIMVLFFFAADPENKG